MPLRIMVLHGPNIDQLGDPQYHVSGVIGGALTLETLSQHIRKKADALGVEIFERQSNHEGALIDFVHEHTGKLDGIMINPAGLSGYGNALRQAIFDQKVPVACVHFGNSLSWDPNIFIEAKFFVAGLGWRSYIAALEAMTVYLQQGHLD